MKKLKIHYLRKLGYHQRPTFSARMSGLWKVCSFLCAQYSLGPPFAWIAASMCRGIEPTSPWHCVGVTESQVTLIAAFRSSALLCLVSLVFSLTTAHSFSMGFRSGEFAGQSSAATPWSLKQLFLYLAVWTGGRSCWKVKIIAKQLASRGKHKVL